MGRVGGGGGFGCEILGSKERSKNIIDLRGINLKLFCCLCLFFLFFFLPSQILLTGRLPVCKNILLKGFTSKLSRGWGENGMQVRL